MTKGIEVVKDSRLDILKEQQKEAFLWALDFINNSDEVEATLSGSAGTGKTFLLQFLLKHIKGSFCITAPVHKALRVLEETVGRKGKTFHSLHGLRPNVDLASFDLNNPQFDPMVEPDAKYYKLIVCDECSQINKSLYTLNLDRAKQYGYKVLYIGDDCQLPPVATRKSKYEAISQTFLVKSRFHLTQVIRQEKGNPLLEPFDLLRSDIANKTNTFTEYIFENRDTINNGEGYKIMNKVNFPPVLKDLYSSDNFKTNLNYARNISYTNGAVAQWNKLIRSYIFPKSTSILEMGDVLMAYNTVVDEFNTPIFVNSETYQVENIRDYVNEYDIKVFAINLINRDTALPTTTLQVIDHKDKKSFMRYYTILCQLHLNAKQSNPGDRRRKWKAYFDFKNLILTMVTFRLPAANNNQVVKKDFDYGYALTAHKAQGSTFEICTIDLNDMLYYTDRYGRQRKYPNSDIINKLIYVGMTRASHKVYLHL